MSQWQFPPDRWEPRKKVAREIQECADRITAEKSLADLRKENQRLVTLIRYLQERLADAAMEHGGGIPEDYQLDLMRGRKLARLVREGDAVQFMGIGMSSIYDVEGYAECLMKKNHEVPDPGCSCGFYIPAKLGDHYGDPRQHWVLDVEFGGKVLDCGMGAIPAPARGYKASWQRVLSVTAPTLCAHCFANAEHVCMQYDNRIEALCPKCAVSRASQVGMLAEEKPLTWVREHLATELIASSLTDALPPEPPAEALLPAWEKEYLQKTVTSAWPAVPAGTTYVPNWTTTYHPGSITTTSTTVPSPIWQQASIWWMQDPPYSSQA